MQLFIWLVISIIFISSNTVYGAELIYERNISSKANDYLTAAEFDEQCIAYKNDNYIMTDIDVYETSQGLRYSMVWKKNTDDRDWLYYRAIQQTFELENLIAFHKLNNFRLSDLEVYMVDNSPRYAAVFVKNKENYQWEYRLNQAKSSFENYKLSKSSEKYNITDLEIRSTNSGLLFSSIWVKYPELTLWGMYFDEPYEQSSQKIYMVQLAGWILTNYEVYQGGASKKCAMIFHRKNDYSGVVSIGLTKPEWENIWRKNRDMGYRLVDFECYKTSNGQRYTGVWIECDDRFVFSAKKAIDQAIIQYKSDNNLPGISVAIIRNGEMLYRRGFGFADVKDQKIAHGETVYLAASVSKAIGGTLAVKLQDERRLRDGRTISLNLNNTTRSYLTNVRKSDNSLVTLPAGHTHTVAQLYAHLGCLKHYDGPNPSIKQYDKAIDALTQIWDPNKAIISNCTVNADSSHYSTHAHTYLAAVLEKVTGRRSASLIRSEIAIPYGLTSMRAQFATNNLKPDYDRAIPYARGRIWQETDNPITQWGPVGNWVDSNKAISYDNSSWKVFGGGIEVSAVDLAYFGWKILDGQIVSNYARDNVLWSRVNSSAGCVPCSYGIGWSISNPGPNLVAQHGGTNDGARCLIRIYKGERLVITIMSNTRDHNVRSIGDLANTIKSLL